MSKYVYFFGGRQSRWSTADMKNLLGGKGANLAEMTQHRPARAGRLHDHHRSLHLLLRPQPQLSHRAARTKSSRP